MSSLRTDPINACMSLGGMYVALGIERCLPLSHGASGCCRFQRMEIARHFQRVVHVPSTMLNDRAAAYGGEDYVAEAVDNIFRLYDPDIVLAFTTCLSETIGDDMQGIVDRLNIPEGKHVVWSSTPSYSGSHLAGYDITVASLMDQLAGIAARAEAVARADALGAAEDDMASDGMVPNDVTCDDAESYSAAPGGSGSQKRSLIVPGWVNPCDIDEIVELAGPFMPDAVILPDTRGVLDVRIPENSNEYPDGGTPLSSIVQIGTCAGGLFVGKEATTNSMEAFERVSGGAMAQQIDLPIGVTATDKLVSAAKALGICMAEDSAIERLAKSRKRTVDVLRQQADYLYGKRVVICADADTCVSLCSFAQDAGFEIACVATGECGGDFANRVHEVADVDDNRILHHVGRLEVEQLLDGQHVDVVLGDSRNKRLAARVRAPLVRIGFPVTDRPLNYLDSYMGYKGTLRLVRDIEAAIMDGQEQSQEPYNLAIASYF